MTFRSLFAPVGCVLALTAAIRAENLPVDHPTATVASKYLKAVVQQDWKTASDMLFPPSLERRRLQMVEAIKNSKTLTDEAAMLAVIGLKDIRDLEKMSPQEAYVADRNAVHKRIKLSDEAIKKKQETFKITVLGVISEDEGKVVHVLVRTKQNTIIPEAQPSGEVTIEELLLISMVQDKDDKTKWLVVPDMQSPRTTPVRAATAAPAP
jgi:hypothetical protein